MPSSSFNPRSAWGEQRRGTAVAPHAGRRRRHRASRSASWAGSITQSLRLYRWRLVDVNRKSRVSALALIVNDSYVVPAIVLLASLEGKIARDVEIVVRDTGLSAASRKLLAAQVHELGCPLRLVRLEAKPFAEAQLLLHWQGGDAFCRLLPLEEVAGDHRHVLDLDVDLLARTSLNELLELVPANGCVISAVPAHFTAELWRDEVGAPQDFGLSESDNFFMGGVTVIDAEAWRECNISRRGLAAFNASPKRWKGDLSVLNAVVGRQWTVLDFKWNVWTLATAGPFRFVRATGAVNRALASNSAVAIAHFPGHFKPWLPGYPLNAWKAEYVRAARRSVLPAELRPTYRVASEISRLSTKLLTRQ